MPTDYKYQNGDRVLGDDGNYETTPGQADAMIREMSCGVIDIDGGEYGNRFFSEVRRGGDIEETRELAKRYYTEVGQRYVDGGGIRDLEITIDVPFASEGIAPHVKCFDIMRNQEIDTALPVVRLN